MKLFSTLAVALVTSTALVTGASATDLLLPEYDEMSAPAGFDWERFYLGVGVSGRSFDDGFNPATDFTIGVLAGTNIVTNDLLVGFEAFLEMYSTSGSVTGWDAGAKARVGTFVSEDAVIYGTAGAFVFDGGISYALVGGGVEFVVSESSTIELEYNYHHEIDPGIFDPFTGHRIAASWNWYVD